MPTLMRHDTAEIGIQLNNANVGTLGNGTTPAHRIRQRDTWDVNTNAKIKD